MKILHVINSLATGGAEKLIIETIPLLASKGFTVDLLLLDGSNTPFLRQLQDLNCCNIFCLSRYSVYNPILIYKIVPYLKKYNLIHVHLFPAQYWVVFAKAISFSKTKLIFTEHNTSNRRMNYYLFRIVDKYIYQFYDKIICISPEVNESLSKYIVFKREDLYTIENGINLDFKVIPRLVNDDLLLSKFKISDRLLIQVAGFREQKDQKTVIRAMQHLPDNIKLLLVGDGVLRQDCQKFVKNLNLTDRVFFLGSRNDVPQLLDQATISIVSSHWEGFGLVAVEGMAAGIPVIASDVNGLSNVVHGAGLLFTKGDHQQLGRLINRLLESKEYYNEIVEKGFERAKKYDINIMVEKTINLYMKYV